MVHPRKNQKVHFRHVEDELLLYDEKKNRVVTLNETAALIWNYCDGKHAKEDIVTELTRRYKVTASKAREDVDKTLARLSSAGVVT